METKTLRDVHWKILDMLYLAPDEEMGLAQTEIEQACHPVPCRSEILELREAAVCNDPPTGYVQKVMTREDDREPVVPHRYRMSIGRHGLKEEYERLCRTYRRTVPTRGIPTKSLIGKDAVAADQAEKARKQAEHDERVNERLRKSGSLPTALKDA